MFWLSHVPLCGMHWILVPWDHESMKLFSLSWKVWSDQKLWQKIFNFCNSKHACKMFENFIFTTNKLYLVLGPRDNKPTLLYYYYFYYYQDRESCQPPGRGRGHGADDGGTGGPDHLRSDTPRIRGGCQHWGLYHAPAKRSSIRTHFASFRT